MVLNVNFNVNYVCIEFIFSKIFELIEYRDWNQMVLFGTKMV